MAAAAGKSPEQVAADLERVADALWGADYLLVLIGPRFDDGGGLANPFDSDRCDPLLVAQPNRFMGFWGGVYNAYMDRSPHEGFSIISRWRDRYYCQDDIRKKGKKKPGGDDEVSEFDRMAKCLVYTANVGNQLQRLGVPSDEVFDALGNITLWQCSRLPPCCQRTALVERNFRFVIDDATKEAMPVKYLTQKPRSITTENVIVVDSDDEELTAMDGGHIKNPFEVKMTKEDQQQRQRRRVQQPRVIRHHPRTQARQARDRFPDLFTGYALEAGQRPIAHAFIDAPYDEQSPRKQPPPRVAQVEDNDAAAAAPTVVSLKPVPFPRGAQRCSHLFEHVAALDMGSQTSNIGSFFPADPDRFSKEREQLFTGVGRIFTSENPSLLNKRCKYVTYNISVIIKPIDNAQPVVSEATRNKLLTVYGKSPVMVPVVSSKTSASESVVVGSIHPSTAAQLDLHRQLLDPWTQGYRGCYFFSNQSARQCMVDQTTDTTIDVVRVAFPQRNARGTVPDGSGQLLSGSSGAADVARLDRSAVEGRDATDGDAIAQSTSAVAEADEPLELPSNCTVSIVCETVLEVASIPVPDGAKPPPLPPQGSSCPTRFVNTWQLVGKLATSTFMETEFKGKETVEYILLGRDHHGVRIGVDKTKPSLVRYMDFQCPSTKLEESLDDLNSGQLGAAFVSHVSFVKERQLAAPSDAVAASLGGKNPSDRPPIPAPNHQLCANCHDVARPFVLMSKPGKKDEGFCHALQAARVKQVKAWEKSMMDCLKTDNTRSIVMLELGCDRKADPVKQYSEKTFKTLKQSKCTHVRISTQDLETKAKKGGDEGNAIALVTNPIQALVALDNLLGERLRKGR